MSRQCARPGCTAVATATFTFDARVQTVWLDAPLDGAARAGELCERHAQRLTPPRGWRVDDRRSGTHPPRPAVERVIEEPTIDDPVFDARGPMLARAFRSSGVV